MRPVNDIGDQARSCSTRAAVPLPPVTRRAVVEGELRSSTEIAETGAGALVFSWRDSTHATCLPSGAIATSVNLRTAASWSIT